MLGWNKVETADVGIDYEDAVAKSGWSQAVGIDVHKDFATALSTFGQRADLHDFTPGPNGNVAVGAIIRTGHNFGNDKTAHLSQPGYGSSGSHNRTSAVKHDPDLTLPRHNRGLVDKTEKSATLVTGLCLLLRRKLRRFLDIGNPIEMESTIRAY